MPNATLFLRTSLYTMPHQGHIPMGVTLIDGEILEQPGSGVVIVTSRMRNDHGTTLSEAKVKLHIPWSKIDHVHLPLEG